MSDLILILLIIVLLVCLIATVGGFLLYSGLLYDVVIKTGRPPVRNLTIAYKLKVGLYEDSGAALIESYSICPKLRTICVFYDDVKKRPGKCRYVVGSVLSEGEEKPDKELQKLYEKFGYKVFSLPEVTHAVTTSFPTTTTLSYRLAAYKVFPRLISYVEEKKLPASHFIHIYSSDVIHYMIPLSRQLEFYVPEWASRGTDITGADSHSDVSSVSGGAPWDSRETSLAASTAASLASSLPLRDIMDANEDSKPRDHSDRGSNESMGSGSSFEELCMDQEGGKEREEKEDRDEKKLPEGEDGARERAELMAEKKEPLGDGEEEGGS